MNPLAARKQLLIAESELNRAQLIEEIAALTANVKRLSERTKSFGLIASSAAALVTGLAAFRGGKTLDVGAKPTWLQSILKGAGVVSTFWLAFRSHGHDRQRKRPTSGV